MAQTLIFSYFLNNFQICLKGITNKKKLRVISITVISECQIKQMVYSWFKATFCVHHCTNHFNRRTEESSSDKKLEHWKTGNILWITNKKWLRVISVTLISECQIKQMVYSWFKATF